MIIVNIFIGICFGLLIFAIYLAWRNNQVFKFRLNILNKIHNHIQFELSTKQLPTEVFMDILLTMESKRDDILYKHSYDSMLYSFKPLKLKYWFTPLEICFIEDGKYVFHLNCNV